MHIIISGQSDDFDPILFINLAGCFDLFCVRLYSRNSEILATFRIFSWHVELTTTTSSRILQYLSIAVVWLHLEV